MNKKSVALVLGVCIIVVIVTLASSMLVRSSSESGFARRNLQSTQAFWLAEAGGQRGLWELNYGTGAWSGWSNDGPDNKSITAALGTIGQYSVTVMDVSADDPTIQATGYVPNAASASRISRSINLTINSTISSPFNYAGFGKTSVTMSGNGKTDSYDSGLGPYGGGNVNSNGDVGTISASSGAIGLSGNAKINGDANTGPGGTVSTSGNAAVNGDIDDTCTEDYTPVTVPSSLTGLISGGAYSLSGNNDATLSSGSYKFDSLSVSGNSDLTLSGDITIYITGNINTSGNGKIVVEDSATIYIDGQATISGNGIANNTASPANLILYSTYDGSGEGIKITGNGDMFGAIYAPETEIKIAGNGDVYGSLIADSFTLTGNGDIHYDENLQNISSGNNRTYSVATWQDQESPYAVTP